MKQLHSALTSQNPDTPYPEEYAVMVFCERFHLTPLEYYQLPKNLVDEWTIMANIRDQVEEQKRSSSSN